VIAVIPRPKTVTAAFVVFLVVIVGHAAFLPEAVIQQWTRADSEVPGSRARYGAQIADSTLGLMHGATVFSTILVLAVYALLVLAAVRMRRGGGAARVVLTVLGALVVAGTLLGSTLLLAAALGLLGSAGIALLWVTPSSAWFRAIKAQRRRTADASSPVAAAPVPDTPAGTS
jgi:hypothetical protein